MGYTIKESQLRNIIKEALVSEMGDTEKGQNLLGRTAERAYQRAQRTSGADRNRYMKTYNDAYHTGGKSANKHLGGTRQYFDNGRDYEYDKWEKEHNGDVAESKNMNKKQIRITETDLSRIVKESVNRVLSEANNHLISVGGVEDTPFTRNNNKSSNSIRLNGVFNTINYSNNPSRAAIEMMQDKLPFDEFIDYCKQRGISPYDYIDTNDFEVEQWIEDYI